MRSLKFVVATSIGALALGLTPSMMQASVASPTSNTVVVSPLSDYRTKIALNLADRYANKKVRLQLKDSQSSSATFTSLTTITLGKYGKARKVINGSYHNGDLLRVKIGTRIILTQTLRKTTPPIPAPVVTPTPTPTPTSTAQAQTITFSAPTSMTVGGADQVLIATASSGLAISYSTGTPTICSIITGSVRALAAGTCSITASQAGNATYAPAESVTQSFTISSAPTGGGGGGPALKKPVFILFSNVLTLSRLEIPEMFYARSSGGTVASYSISPALPVGMTFDTRTASVGGASLVNLGATTYTITATNAAGTANATFDLTINGIPCDGSFTCAVGDTGPGGGLVFYVSSDSFTATGTICNSVCKYLESAPTNPAVSNYWLDTTTAWSGETGTAIGTTGTEIGAGYANTLAMIAQDSTPDRAGTISRAYRGPNNLSDWYLPSIDELKALRDVECGISSTPIGGYQSSTEDASSGASGVNFCDPTHDGTGDKEYPSFVRPIRAFGDALTLTSLDVKSGSKFGGTVVTITGTGFAESATVTFGAREATLVTFIDSTTIIATSPSNGSKSYIVTVTNKNGQATQENVDFSYYCDGGNDTICLVGEQGPGGGTIFYVSPDLFTATGTACDTRCKYLESAPTYSSKLNYWTDTATAWSGETGTAIGTTGTEIGSGYASTLAIITQDSTPDKAGTISHEYRGPNNLSDWFLPSMDELRALYNWQCANEFIDSNSFWSSSESLESSAWAMNFGCSFENSGDSLKEEILYVRPIRAFGPPLMTFTSAQTPSIIEVAAGHALESATVGIEVRADSYTVTGATSPVITYTFQWETSTASSGSTWYALDGATSETLTATSDLAGTYLRVVVSANASGYVETSIASVGLPVVAILTVGGAGTGGGLVFYHSVAGFSCGETLSSTCHYLEVAPNGWNTVSDPVKLWAVIGQKTNDVSGIENDLSAANSDTRIGLGLKNSIAIVLQGNDTTTAAGVARAYLGGGMSDWYLPATAELNLLCQWNRGVVQDVTISCTGGTLNSATFGASSAGFVNSVYWSSSEGVLFTVIKAWRQSFIGGNQSPTAKESSYYVRPIRAF